MADEELSIVADNGRLVMYYDLLANVRHDGRYHSVRSLVQPEDPEVIKVADALSLAPDFFEAAWEFVDSFTTYKSEVGDFWRTPAETLAAEAGDCDDLAILLCSILRCYMPAERIFCAFGLWVLNGSPGGHMWLVTDRADGTDKVIEATAAPDKRPAGRYVIHGLFNDKYTFSSDLGLREFNLHPVYLGLY